MVARSYLYVPGTRPELFAKALGSGADAIVVDLEDAVAPVDKDAARGNVAGWVGSLDPGDVDVWVRVNNHPDLLATDVAAVSGAAGLTGLYLPKVAGVDDIDRMLASSVGPVAVTALVESAAGWLSAASIASHHAVVRLACGEADLGSELGISASADEREFLPFRMQMIAVSVAAGIDVPTAPVPTNYRDLDALRLSTEALKRMGFRSRALIHPAQVRVVNEIFTPTPDEVETARRIVAGAEAADGGVFAGDGGVMVDEAIVKGARRTLALAEEIAARGA